jgi:hypothetical protein
MIILYMNICGTSISQLNKTAGELVDFANKYKMEPLSEPELDTFTKWGNESVTLSINVSTMKYLPELPGGMFLYEGIKKSNRFQIK